MIWAVACPVLYTLVLWCCIPFVYGIVDDRSMMEIVSGQYLGHPDAHMIFTGYWYSLAVAGLYCLTPKVDWYAICYLLLQCGCMGLMIYRLLGKCRNTAGKAKASALIFLWAVVLGIQTFTQITFTTTAAVLAVTVIFWYMTAEMFGKKELAILFVLCFLTVELRFSVFCMIVPVCGVLWLFRVWEDRGKDRGHLLVPLLAAGALILYVMGLFVGYGGKDWRDYNEYNNIRSLIYDYDDYMFPRYEDETELYQRLGIESKSRAKNLYYYNYTADDRIEPVFFGQYLSERRLQMRERVNPFQRLKESIKNYVKGTLEGKYQYRHLLALLGYGILALYYGLRREWKRCLRTCCVPGVQLVLWLYLIYRGRMPERVLISMNLMLIVPLLILWLEAFSDRKFLGRLQKAGMGILFAALGISAVWHIATIRQENMETARWNRNVEGLKEYCMEHPENFYFNDVTSLAMTTYNVYLWQKQPYVMNYMSLGDWMSFSPLWKEKLAQEGIDNVKEALYGQENVYLVCSFDKGLQYLEELYEGVTFVEVDKVHQFGVYKMETL